MEMQIPQLRQLFESRVGQISSVLAADTPKELGRIDPTMRGLKGFLFALEGMLRQNELQHMPFTARSELYQRVDQAIDLLQTLPDSLDGEQALGVLRVMDSLHRLCLQESLMASGLDASKLGRLTVILERKLGEVLDTIDRVGETGQDHAGRLEQATQECLDEIQGTYKREAAALSSSASSAVDSIRSQAKTIQRQQAEAMETVKALQGELRSRQQQCQTALNEQLDAARAAVDEIRGQQQAVGNLATRAQEQLDSTRAAFQMMKETTEATRNTRDDLQAGLTQGRDIIRSIHELLESGTKAARELADKVTEAQQGLTMIQQTADAGAAARETVAAAEKTLQEARQRLDAQLETAAGVLAQIQAQEKNIDSAVEQVLQHRLDAEQITAAAADTLQQGQEDLTQVRALLDRGRQDAERLEQLAEISDELKARVSETLDRTQQRIKQIEDEAAQAATVIQEGKGQALSAARNAMDETERLQRQFAQSLSEQREAARDAVAALRGDQAIGADLLARTQQDIETLAGQITHIKELGAAAGDTEAQIRALLDRGQQDAEKLEQLAQTSDALKARVSETLDRTQQRIKQIEDEAAQTATVIQAGKDQALNAVRNAVDEAEGLQRQFAQSLSEQREAACDAVAALRGDQAAGADLLARTQQDVETLTGQITRIEELHAAAGDTEAQVRQKLNRAGLLIAKLKDILAAGAEAKSQINGHLAESTAAHERMDNLVRETAAATKAFRLQQDQALRAVRDETEAAQAQRKTCETAMAEKLEAAGDLVTALRTHRERAEAWLAEIHRQRDSAHTASEASGEARAAAAQATGEVQATQLEARRAGTDIAGLLAAATEARSKIDAELGTATRAKEQAEETRRKLDALLVRIQEQGREMAATNERTQQIVNDLHSEGQEVLAKLTRQNAELTERGEKLQRELKDLSGQGADSGLFSHFDALAQQNAPQQQKWLRRMSIAGIGGGAALAVTSWLVALYSGWAAGAVLVAGLVPLGFFMYLCVSQYASERHTESEHQYRAVLSRSLTAYRRLLVNMQEEGIADSAYVDRMLSSLFSAPTPPTSDIEAPEIKAIARAKPSAGAPEIVEAH